MSMSHEDIIDYALRYISEDEIADFPMPGDHFAMLVREMPENKILNDDEGWEFAGYNITRKYSLDTESKPAGKWIWHEFVSLVTFPPSPSVLKLQPPHIAKGIFQDPSRTRQYRIVKVDLSTEGIQRQLAGALSMQQPDTLDSDNAAEAPEQPQESKILKFPGPRAK
jgi:hypothetical protein